MVVCAEWGGKTESTGGGNEGSPSKVSSSIFEAHKKNEKFRTSYYYITVVGRRDIIHQCLLFFDFL